MTTSSGDLGSNRLGVKGIRLPSEPSHFHRPIAPTRTVVAYAAERVNVIRVLDTPGSSMPAEQFPGLFVSTVATNSGIDTNGTGDGYVHRRSWI